MFFELYILTQIKNLMNFLYNLIILLLLAIFPSWCFAQTDNPFINTQNMDSCKTKLALALKQGNLAEIGWAYVDLAWLQSSAGMFWEALPNSQRAIDIFEQIGEPRGVMRACASSILVHDLTHNYEKEEIVIRKSLSAALTLKDTTAAAVLLNALSKTFDKQKRYKESIVAMEQALDLALKKGEPPGFYLNGLCSTYLNMGDLDKALPLARQAQVSCLAEGDSISYGFAIGNEAFIHAKKGNFKAFDDLMKQTEAILKSDSSDAYTAQALAHMKALVAEMRGDFKTAYYQMSLFHTLDSTASAEERATQYANMEIAYQTQKKEQENERLNDKVSKQKLIFAAIGIILSLGLILLFVQRQKLKISNQFLAISQQLTKEKLARTKQELADFTQSLHEKVSMIERLKSDLAAQQNSAEKDNLLEQMSQAVILTTAQWAAFRIKFERVYPNFFAQLYQHVPQATEADLRFAALTKLNLSDVEIATILGISSDSVVKTRYRLRKKVTDNDVIELIRQFA